MVYWAGKAVEAVRIRSNPHTHTTFSDGRDALLFTCKPPESAREDGERI